MTKNLHIILLPVIKGYLKNYCAHSAILLNLKQKRKKKKKQCQPIRASTEARVMAHHPTATAHAVAGACTPGKLEEPQKGAKLEGISDSPCLSFSHL